MLEEAGEYGRRYYWLSHRPMRKNEIRVSLKNLVFSNAFVLVFHEPL